ncbi:nucleotide disphospho-sugar-binding domain-containing protein [Prosthecobacter sp.]|uniref:nucleotide disphospho-sugar-binding domain-containing protein n=1 Tax=Prosthecobacter sp. TaxID=1965333 RepID=UPI00378494F6
MSTEPKNILFTTWEGGGNVPPVITLARKLRERGHRVRLMSDEASREDAAAAGIAFHAWQAAPNRADKTPASCPLRDWEAASPQEGIGLALDKILFGPSLDYARDLAAELDREPADLVVTSDMLPGILAGCESRAQPVAILSANLCLYPLEGMPTFGPGLPPARTAEEEAMHAQIRQGTLAMLDAHLGVLNDTRVALGLMPIETVLEQLEVATRFLLASSRSFDFPVKELPEQIRYIGPQLDEPAWAKPWRSPWPENDPRPVIAVCFSSTYQAHEGVLQKVIDAAAELPVRVLVTLGQVASESVRPAENTVVVASAPHNAVMQQAAVVVTHGGHGTVMRALSHHRPMLVIPHGRDQDENAVRVVVHGAGLRMTASSTLEEIRTALSRLITEPAFTEGSRRLGTAIAEEAESVCAIAELEALAEQPASCCC